MQRKLAGAGLALSLAFFGHLYKLSKPELLEAHRYLGPFPFRYSWYDLGLFMQ